MPFYSYDDVLRVFQVIQDMPCEVSEELRGWRWAEPPLLSPYSVKINASDLSFGCKTGRLAFLRHYVRAGERAGESLRLGSFVHRVIATATAEAKAILYCRKPASGVDFFDMMMQGMPHATEVNSLPREYVRVLNMLWRRAALTYSSAYDKVLELSRYLSLDGLVSRVVPWICEFPIDGRLLGLNRAIRIDALVPPALIIEFKTRKPCRDFEITLAGYALCFESQYKIPVNHAVILYLVFDDDMSSFRVYENILRIDDGVRMEFVEKRDLFAQVASSGVDPGLPEVCDPYCPYLGVCRDGD
ncbi:MAG TPA: type I-A CRISPR-associated protein Cas4/Csa1 [Aigarchaeota archaeon]|nr:type I-A CRISPR-associated protein Cas4/Csa1 [Aigarchaeota archaeon]